MTAHPGKSAAADRSPGRRLGETISIRGVAKTYGNTSAVSALDLEIAAGEFVTLLGPSGSGKTTTLMMIAGFTDPSAGEIRIGGREVTHLPPHKRSVGVVFQHYALFPHLTVAENVAFPLRMRGLGKAQIREKVQAALDLVEMPGLGHRFPGQLSGGQQQRVAFARAIVFDPPVLLLDEPLGALDKKLRENLQLEIKALHARLGLTMVYVTHDQAEALAMSDRVAVMNSGQLAQIGAPSELYEAPATRFVADFIGEANFIAGRVSGLSSDGGRSIETQAGITCVVSADVAHPAGAAVLLLVRPERVLIESEAAHARNRFTGILKDVSYIGDSSKYVVSLPTGETITARVPNRRGSTAAVKRGESIVVGWHPEDALLFRDEGSAVPVGAKTGRAT